MALQLRRGLEADRVNITPVEGELLYTTDEKKVYVGDGNTAGGVVIGGTGGAGGSYQATLTQINGDWHDGAPNVFAMDDMPPYDIIVVSQNGANSDINLSLPSAPTHGKMYTIKFTGRGNPQFNLIINAAGNIDTVAQSITVAKDNGHATFVWDNEWTTWWVLESDLVSSISTADLKTLVADSTDFADFQSRISAL